MRREEIPEQTTSYPSEGTKRCYKCGACKPRPEFYKNRSKRDGYTDECKSCKRRQVATYSRTERGRAVNRSAVRRYRKTRRGRRKDARYYRKVKGVATPGYVYVVTHPSWPWAVKVGFAKNPEKRLSNYQTGCPTGSYRLYGYVYDDDARHLEGEVLQVLDLKRSRGEWFYVRPDVALRCVQRVQRLLIQQRRQEAN